MSKVYYKGFIIYERDNGMWEVGIDGRFIEFTSLLKAMHRINYWAK